MRDVRDDFLASKGNLLEKKNVYPSPRRGKQESFPWGEIKQFFIQPEKKSGIKKKPLELREISIPFLASITLHGDMPWILTMDTRSKLIKLIEMISSLGIFLVFGANSM